MKTFSFAFLLFILLPSVSYCQQEFIHFHFNDNSTSVFNLEEVQKLDFDNDQLRLHQTNGTVLSWDIGVIDYYSYNDGVTGIESATENKLSMSVFPNPSSSQLHINYNLLSIQEAVLTIQNLEGRVVETFNINQVSKSSKLIDVSAYPTGQYFVRIDGAKFSLSKRFIKN